MRTYLCPRFDEGSPSPILPTNHRCTLRVSKMFSISLPCTASDVPRARFHICFHELALYFFLYYVFFLFLFLVRGPQYNVTRLRCVRHIFFWYQLLCQEPIFPATHKKVAHLSLCSELFRMFPPVARVSPPLQRWCSTSRRRSSAGCPRAAGWSSRGTRWSPGSSRCCGRTRGARSLAAPSSGPASAPPARRPPSRCVA